MGAFSDVQQKSPIAAFRGSIAITPSDSTDISPTRGIQTDDGGTIKMTFENGTIDTITLLANVPYSYCVTRIWEADTDATNIHALY